MELADAVRRSETPPGNGRTWALVRIRASAHGAALCSVRKFFCDSRDKACFARLRCRHAGESPATARRAYFAQLNAIQTHDTRARLKAIKIPTMVLTGAEDILIPMNLSRELHGLIPGAQFATAKGGHACMREQPETVQRGCPGFVGKHRKSSK